MSETMKVTGKSGKEFVSTGSKLGDFLSVTKNVAKAGLKDFGKALLGGGLNMLLNAGIGALIEGGITLATKAYDKLAHAQEKTIEKGKEASQKIQDNYSSIASNDQWKNTNLERFTELAKGVSITGKNISLTTEEFSEYQSLASDLAGIMPNLVVGFNELGQPIIKAATSMDTLNKAFRDNDVKKYQENMKNTSDVLDAFKTQYDEVGNVFKESGIKQKLAAYKDITSIYNDLKSQKLTDWQGNKFLKDRLRTSDKDGYDYNTIKDISKDLGIKTDELYENIDTVLEGEAQIRQEMDMVASSVKNSLPSFFKAKDSYHDIISKSPNVDAFMQSIIAGLDSETILNTLGSEEDIEVWAEKITNGLQNKEVQNAIDGLYTIDQKKSDMSFKAYDKQVRGFVKKIGKNIDGINEKQVLKGFDLDEEFANLGKKYKKIANSFGEDFANSLSISDLELATDIISQQDVKNAEQLSKAMQAAKQAAFDINANPIFDKIAEAKETKNSGDDYVKATTYLKEAKEMFDKGLVGTDDFKSIAKYLSPTGSEDPANFLENYGKAARYLTEDSSGVKAFLKDLENKGYASLQKMADGTEIWSYNMKDLYESSQNMGMGFEFFMDMFGRLEDYGFSNNFVTSQEQGIQKIVDKTVELSKEKQKLAEMERTGKYRELDEQGIMREKLVNDTVLNAQKEKVASLEADVQEVSTNLEQFVNDSIDATVTKVEQSKEVFDILKQKYDELEADPNKYGENTEAVKKKLAEQLKTFADEAGLELDAELNIINKDEAKEEIESTKPVIEAEVRTKDAVEQATKSADIVQQLITNSGSDVKLDFGVTSEADINAQIAAIINALEPLKNEKGNIPISVDGAEEAKEALTALILKRQEVIQPAVMTIDTSQLESDIGEVISKVQEFQTAYNKVQELNTIRSSGLTVDTEEFTKAKQDLENALSELQALGDNPVTADILAKLEIDPNSIGSAESSIKDIKPELVAKLNTEEIENYKPVPQDADIILHVKDDEYVEYTPAPKDADVNLKPVSGDVDGYVAPPKDADVNYHPVDPEIQAYEPDDEDADVNYHIEDSEIQEYVPPDKDAVVTYAPDTSGLPTSFDPITRVVNYVKGSDPGSASGTMLSPAHVNGTAYNTLNMSPAHAGGNVAIQRDEKSLINEVGMESIVRDGIWRLIPGGAHFEQLKKGDIIFNASQTEQLLKYGNISGHGRAYADGTVGNVRDLVRNPLSAYAGGAGHGQFWGGAASGSSSGNKGNKWTSGNYGNYGQSSSNVAKDTGKIADNMEKASEEAEKFEEIMDYIEIAIDRIEREISNLERISDSAHNTYSKRNNALRSQMSTIRKEIDLQQQAYQRYMQQANSVPLSQYYKDKILNGTIDIETITDEELKKNIDKYKEYADKALDARDAVEELKESVRDLYVEAFDRVVEEFDNVISIIEHKQDMLEGYINQTETQGYLVSAKYYEALIDNEQNNLKQLEEERKQLLNALGDAMANGQIEQGSESWYKMQQQINDVNKAIQDSNTSLIEFGNNIRQLKWDLFDKMNDLVSTITDESDFLIELMSNDKLFDDNGKFTEQGKATAALHGVNHNTYMAQADDYYKEMKEIEKQLKSDPYNQDLVERRQELLELQQESILAAEKEKEAIRDLIKDGIEKQLDALQKLIDKYLDALNSQQDMLDYQRQIAEKQKEISEIEKQLEAYKSDDSEEAMAKRQELESALEEAKQDLEDAQMDRSIAEQEKLLNELFTEYEQLLNMRLDNIDQLLSELVTNVNKEAQGIRDTIATETKVVGYNITNTMNTVLGANGTIANILTTYKGSFDGYKSDFSSKMTGVISAIDGIKDYLQKAQQHSNSNAQNNIGNIYDQQSQQQRPSYTPPSYNPPSYNYGGSSGGSSSGSGYGGGDGVPRVGDAVTYTNGMYYYSSSGAKPAGNQMLGKKVYIGHINNASWATHPYALYRDRGFTQGLGWVALNQISGYKTGLKHANTDELAWTNEGKPETLIRKDGAILTAIKKGDSVLNNNAHENIWEMANNPSDFIRKNISKMCLPNVMSSGTKQIHSTGTVLNVNIGIDKVQDYNDFVHQLQGDKNMKKFIQSLSLDPLMGKNSLNKYNLKIGK